MKKLATIFFTISWSVLLCGCPFSSPYQIDEAPTIYVEDALIGSWATFIEKPNSNKAEPIKLIVSKKNNTEYNVAFTGSIKELKPFKVVDNDTIAGTAFMSTIASNQFLNISIKGSTYIAEIKLKEGVLNFMPLAEHFTSKMLKSNSDLKTAIFYHYQTRVHALYDEDFILKDMVKVN